MPLPYYEDDRRDNLIRTPYATLESATWWKSLGIDALILYSWGAPRYLNIAKAVKQAGIRLVVHMDCTDDVVGCMPPNASLFKKAAKRLYSRIMDIRRSQHLKQADAITMGATAAEHLSKRLFYGKWLTDKLYPSPCPVAPDFRYEGGNKEDLILCIGRWDDRFQKRPEFLMRTLAHYYSNGGTAKTHIYGCVTYELYQLHCHLPASASEKIEILGILPHEQLKEQYNRAKIILCSSRYEGSHNVSAEALCCGCSVVTPNRPQHLRNLLWYTTKNSGTVSTADTPESLSAALQTEMQAWQQGLRDPQQIATAWHPHFHVHQVYNNIFN